MRLTILLTIGALLAVTGAQADESISNAPSHIELRDQFGVPQRLEFPNARVTLLTIADKKGAAEVDGWMAALKPLYAGRVDIRGVANVAGVPRFLQGRVRNKFQEKHRYPVMMDWSGTVCEGFGYRPGTANVLVIGRDGRIYGRLWGKATKSAVTSACRALNSALAVPTKSAEFSRSPSGQGEGS